MIARIFSRTLLRAAAPRAPISSTLPRLTTTTPLSLPLRSAARPFTTTLITRGSGETDVELSAKLAQELSYEQENSNLFIGDSPTQEPGFVTEFKQAGIWKITDKPSVDEVILERDFGNEHIQIMFSVGELDTSGPLPVEDGEEPPAAELEEGDEGEPQFPVRISATITKPTEGALMVDAFVQDGDVHVDNIAYYHSKELATKIDAEADFARKAVYLGPSFETLDDGLQDQFRHFLAERGIDANLALFVPNYAEYKEQREYCGWLGNVRGFIDA